ncbi:hypothetical protein [Thioalkalivibrio nitratireducens]|uniref:hypothetical protein n=1 Tax=Thioalkalivibrio nitratireducens TaxID=186931 RepID=UPI001F3F3174|nr:hypothetical protein [Thioalkalivibrio nitratireducens]
MRQFGVAVRVEGRHQTAVTGTPLLDREPLPDPGSLLPQRSIQKDLPVELFEDPAQEFGVGLGRPQVLAQGSRGTGITGSDPGQHGVEFAVVEAQRHTLPKAAGEGLQVVIGGMHG